jgi:hypothetical protein
VPPVVSGPIAMGAPLGQVIVRNGDQIMTQVGVVSPVAFGPEPQIVRSVPLPAAMSDMGRSTIMNDAAQEKK